MLDSKEAMERKIIFQGAIPTSVWDFNPIFFEGFNLSNCSMEQLNQILIAIVDEYHMDYLEDAHRIADMVLLTAIDILSNGCSDNDREMAQEIKQSYKNAEHNFDYRV